MQNAEQLELYLSYITGKSLTEKNFKEQGRDFLLSEEFFPA